jgi:hypothetical protein
MRLTTILTGIVLSGVLASGAWAQEYGAKNPQGLSKNWASTATGAPEKVVYDAASAMDWMRTYRATGSDWLSGDEKQPRVGTSITLIAAGSTVMERVGAGTPNEMTIMYHMDGPDVLLGRHYCAAKNVPQWKFVRTDKPGQIKFVHDGGWNLDPAVDTFAAAVTFQVIDKDTYSTIFTTSSGGKLTINPKPITYHRISTKSN